MSTRDLGDLSRGQREPVDMTFRWFGVTIRVAPDAGDLSLIAFLEQAETIDVGDEVGIMLATKEFLRAQVDERDWTQFFTIARQQRQQFKDLLQVAKDITAAVARFPMTRPSDSSDGRPHTSTTSKVGSSSQVAVQAMADLKGRPDLKMFIWQAQQAKAAQEAEAG